MALETGTRLGIYEIVAPIGAGGMGEVYRAHDTKLGRDVAIKTLPSSLANEPDRLARFEREAKLLATLNHAHIGAIYGLDEHDGTQFIVMELVEGETLEARLKEGALPIDDALRIALQIVEALEAAHEKGVVHRDLKPANVMLTADGVVKVLDFGLAKAFSGDPNAASPAHSPALSMAMTQQGLILGTAGYMSPEQASGQATDQRADVWAFGVVLYEMLTGLPLFSGESVPHVLADVLRTDPDYSRLPKNVDPRLQLLLECCLEKKVRNRYHSIADVRIDIEKILRDPRGAIPASPTAAARPAGGHRLVQLGIAVLATGVVVGSAVWFGLRPAPRPINRFAFEVLSGQAFRFPGWDVVTFGANGRSIVYNTTDGLFVRDLDELEPRLIAGTEEGLAAPSIAPDGQFIAFSAVTGELKRISIDGGTSIALTNVVTGGSGTSWDLPDWILFGQPDGIYRVSANGGTSQRIVTSTEGEIILNHHLLPDGDLVLFSSTRAGSANDAQIYVQSISTGERTILVNGGTDARYLPSGHLVYAFQNTLFAAAFDLDTLAVSGAAVPIVQGLMRGTAPTGSANYGVSEDGTLVYAMGDLAADARVLVWVGRDGSEEAIAAPPRAYTSPRLSPDGTKVAINARDQEIDIWIWDMARTTLTRLTFDPGQDRFPAWSPDGQRVAYSSQSTENEFNWQVVWRASDGTGATESLAGSVGQMFPTAFLPDASGLLVYGDIVDPDDDIAVVMLDGQKQATPLLDTTFAEAMPEISPDGRWMAYVSNESGIEEIYVRPYPDINAGRWQISTGGGTEPLWSRDGEELYFRRAGAVMAVPVQTDAGFVAGNAELVFEGPYFEGISAGGRSYDVTADGERFLMIRAADNTSAVTRIVIVENWVEELQRLVPTE